MNSTLLSTTRRVTGGAVARARTTLLAARRAGERGMTTAEYAVGVLVACSFAMVLLGVVKSGPVKNALSKTVVNALGLGN